MDGAMYAWILIVLFFIVYTVVQLKRCWKNMSEIQGAAPRYDDPPVYTISTYNSNQPRRPGNSAPIDPALLRNPNARPMIPRLPGMPDHRIIFGPETHQYQAYTNPPEYHSQNTVVPVDAKKNDELPTYEEAMAAAQEFERNPPPRESTANPTTSPPSQPQNYGACDPPVPLEGILMTFRR